MNIFQAANAAATFLILSALVAGIGKHLEGIQSSIFAYFGEHIAIVYLGVFVVVFRVKTLLDDHRHFGESYQDKSIFRYVGFFLAVLSWFFWGLAAYVLEATIRSSELMATSILVATLWVVVHLFEIATDSTRRSKEALTSVIRQKWVLLNVGYILCLVAHVGWFRPVIHQGASAPLLALLGLLFFDVATGTSFRGIISSSSKGG